MAIDYLEIRDINREIIGIIDSAKSIIWHSVWFGVGDFEIYAPATPEHLNLLQKNRYVTKGEYFEEPDIGIIEKIEIVTSLTEGTMIIASGRFAKATLASRLIYQLSGKTNTPTTLRGNVEENIRRVVSNNAISCSFDSRRNIPVLGLGTLANIPARIVDKDGNATEKQVSYQNLLDYTDSVLQEYGLSAFVYLDIENISKKLLYRVRQGTDRSQDNTDGNEPILFSRDFDNLSESNYQYDITTEENTALIGGEGEGKERFYSLVATDKTGLERKEVWVDGSSLNQTLKASDLQGLFPTGTFSGINFVVAGVTYAVLVVDDKNEQSLSTLQSKFPTGTVSGTKFIVSGTVYANKVYGDDNNYKLTPLGYKALLDKDGKEGDYTLSDSVYKSMLDSLGKQTLEPMKATEIFSGTIDVSYGNYVLNRDFFLGDIVTVQENSIGVYMNVRITEVTEVQDENGYTVDAKYE